MRGRTWFRSALAPRERFLPGVGSRLGRHPRLAAPVLAGLRRVPGERLRNSVYLNVSTPLTQRMTAELVVRVSSGARMKVDTSDLVGRVLATSGVWEPHVTAAFSRLVAPGDVCVDVGAHHGYFTLLASRLAGPTGRVIALEPNPATYEALCSNLALNDAANVTALRVAAGAADGRAQVVAPPAGNTGESAIRDLGSPGSSPSVLSVDEVAVRSVSSLVDAADVSRLTLVKVDVEGYEAQVLHGLGPLFRSGGRPALLVELHPGESGPAIDVLGELSRPYGCVAYELVRNDPRRRFSAVAPARELPQLSELAARPRARTAYVLVVPGDLSRNRPSWNLQ